jgi:uncharacterized protein
LSIFLLDSQLTTMLLDDLHQQSQALHRLAQLHGAKRLRVFGSVARRQERADSDIDFLVELPRGYSLFKQRLPLTQGLADLLHRRVEVIPEHELSPHLREAILREAVEI